MKQLKSKIATVSRSLIISGLLLLLVLLIITIIKVTIPNAQGGLLIRNTTQPIIQTSIDLNSWRDTAAAAVMHTQLEMIKTITPSPPPFTRPPTRTSAPFVTGLFEVTQGDGYLWNYPMTTLWKAVINGERTSVFVGGYQDTNGVDPSSIQGAVFVRVSSANLRDGTVKEYPAPIIIGILRIAAVNGYRLSLSGPNGEIFYFDVPSRQYVESLTVTVTAPTVTPIQITTPDSTPSLPSVNPSLLPTWYSPSAVYPPPETLTPSP